MKMTITFTCGHTDTVDIFGNPSEIELQAKGMSEKCECPLCAMHRFGEWPEPSFEEAMEISKAFKVPKLKGNADIVRQATVIRAHLLRMPIKLMNHLYMQEGYAMAEIPYFHSTVKDAFIDHEYPINCLVGGFRNEMARITNAQWWLDNQDKCARTLVALSMRLMLEKAFTFLKGAFDAARLKMPDAPPEQCWELAKRSAEAWVMDDMERKNASNNRKHPASKKQKKRRK